MNKAKIRDNNPVILSKLILANMKKNGIEDFSLESLSSSIDIIVNKVKKINGMSGIQIPVSSFLLVYESMIDFVNDEKFITAYLRLSDNCHIEMTEKQTNSILETDQTDLKIYAEQVVREYQCLDEIDCKSKEKVMTMTRY